VADWKGKGMGLAGRVECREWRVECGVEEGLVWNGVWMSGPCDVGNHHDHIHNHIGWGECIII